jgi:2-C-methyl-D-erythritol 4-phosphate cytidylyltransferase
MSPYVVIVPAAGSGSRMGRAVPKVLLSIGAKASSARTVLRYSTDAFLRDPNCLKVVVCAPKDYIARFCQEVSPDSRVSVIEGGATRQASVFAGVLAVGETRDVTKDTVVLVHDAARACVTQQVIQRVVAAVLEHGAATAAVPIVDSVCRSTVDGAISEYVDRASLWSIQTPQGFRLGELKAAHERALKTGQEVFDDASLISSVRKVVLVRGDRLNIKITQPGDLPVASMVCETMENKNGLSDRTGN